ncbi:MAG: ComEC/Rec2 family competence protein [Phycisphaerae bacterium]
MDQVGDVAGSTKPRLARAPLAPVAAAMALGIVAGRYLEWPVGIFATVAAAGVMMAIVFVRREHLRPIAAVAAGAAIFALAAVYAHIAYYTISRDHIVNYTDGSPMPATIRGQIVSSPAIVEDEGIASAGYRRPPRTVFLLEASAIRATTSQPTGPAKVEWLPVSGLVRATIREEAPALAAGQEVELVGTIGRVRGPDNPGQVDWSASARINHTLVWISVPVSDGAAVNREVGRSAVARCYWHIRAAIRQHLNNCGDAEDGRLVNALIIGERHPAMRQLNQDMVRAGTVHYLSISGDHLAIFLGFLYLLCRVSLLTPRRSAIIVLVILTAYMVLAEPNPPLWRSAIMAAALCLSVIFSRQRSALNALSAAAVILLALDPLQLFSAGFQLSFGIVAGMVLMHGPLRDLLFGRFLRRRGLMVFRREHRVRRWLHFTGANWAIAAVTVSTNAYIVSAPLVAYHFGLFSPYASVLSLLLAPLVTAVLVPGYISTALAWPMPNLSAVMGDLAGRAADLLTWAVGACNHLPGLCFDIRPVGVWWVPLCYAAIAVILLHRRLPRGRVWAGAAAAILIAAIVWTQWPAPRQRAAELDVLAVGDGQCIILRGPSGLTCIIDAGTKSDLDVYQQVLGPFIQHERLPAPAMAMVSHANTDHYSALAALVERTGLDKLYLSDYFRPPPAHAGPAPATMPATAGGQPSTHPSPRTSRNSSPDAVAVGMLALMRASDVEVVHIRAGDTVALDGSTTIEALWPPGERREDLTVNDTSLVLLVTCNGQRVLLSGDGEAVPQAALAAQFAKSGGPAAEVLVMPHHGSWRPTLPAFVAAVRPTHVIISNSHEPRPPANNKDAADFHARLKAEHFLYSTARNGWIQVRFGGGKIEVRTMR